MILLKLLCGGAAYLSSNLSLVTATSQPVTKSHVLKAYMSLASQAMIGTSNSGLVSPAFALFPLSGEPFLTKNLVDAMPEFLSQIFLKMIFELNFYLIDLISFL